MRVGVAKDAGLTRVKEEPGGKFGVTKVGAIFTL